jgi:2-keto-4-pentenoate hydratase/2-oxohepta-3-ene-1,7-dioic acid hydratase in catechol pathway
MIRNIWAIGRNYADHTKELGNDVPTEPMIFLKAGSCAVFGEEFFLPTWSHLVHHEVELALKFDNRLEISEAAIALDLTERHFQNILKAKGSPWTLAKSFTGACPLSPFFHVKSLDELQQLDISLMINGEIRQQGNTSQMIFPLEEQIIYVRNHFPVEPGDLLLTGTPSGVGPLHRGDELEATLSGKITQRWLVK